MAFYERITELPLIYDAARGADVLDTLAKAPVPDLAALMKAPKVRRAESRQARSEVVCRR